MRTTLPSALEGKRTPTSVQNNAEARAPVSPTRYFLAGGLVTTLLYAFLARRRDSEEAGPGLALLFVVDRGPQVEVHPADDGNIHPYAGSAAHPILLP